MFELGDAESIQKSFVLPENLCIRHAVAFSSQCVQRTYR